ncbi:hypothetical protein ABE41_016110 [Fictibacillus arsenicus]|uniref:Uncharacterized protein n=1 Tax=Fictibacillus arsenicus TaxID=255247 RepID=A0A1B1Z804_9BACL|nr:hypothetical protein ABE41_016110 [Fictibacillus arsenicus]
MTTKAAIAEFYAVKKKILAGKRKMIAKRKMMIERNMIAKKNHLLNAVRKSPLLAHTFFGVNKNLHLLVHGARKIFVRKRKKAKKTEIVKI